MHDLLLGLRKHDGHDYHELKVVINIGIMVYDFFSIYKKCEPDAIASYEELDKLLGNLNRGKLCNYIIFKHICRDLFQTTNHKCF